MFCFVAIKNMFIYVNVLFVCLNFVEITGMSLSLGKFGHFQFLEMYRMVLSVYLEISFGHVFLV